VVCELFDSGFLVGLDDGLGGFVAVVVPPMGLHELLNSKLRPFEFLKLSSGDFWEISGL
jgi:hypothetical protein